jgi:integrase
VEDPKEALEILNDRSWLKGSSMSWVFSSKERKKSKSRHLEEPKAAWKRILDRAGLKNLRIHALRRALASYQAIAGFSEASASSSEVLRGGQRVR